MTISIRYRAVLTLLAVNCLLLFTGSSSAADSAPAWSTLITPKQLQERLQHPQLLLIDVRSEKEYAAGHIPGAINLPGTNWRTPATKNPAKDGLGQQIFRTSTGDVDVARYEKFLSEAGVKNEDEVVVYGNYAGKADGSVPAAILLKLGHASVAFLDGVGLDQWTAAGQKSTQEPKTLKPSNYHAKLVQGKLWSYDDVVKNLKNEDVVIVDSRSVAEYEGWDLRDNQRGGHIPGAKLLSSDDFLDKDKHTTIDLDAAKKKIEAVIPKGKKVVIYCQSGTRCSLKELMLKDLGYDVALYDASWQEWGNKADAPIENAKDAKPESTKPEPAKP